MQRQIAEFTPLDRAIKGLEHFELKYNLRIIWDEVVAGSVIICAIFFGIATAILFDWIAALIELGTAERKETFARWFAISAAFILQFVLVDRYWGRVKNRMRWAQYSHGLRSVMASLSEYDSLSTEFYGLTARIPELKHLGRH